MSNLDSRLGGHEGPAPSAARATPDQLLPAGDFTTIRCRSAVTELHAVNLVADIADAAATSRHVVVDLALTSRIDATGLGALVSGARSCRDAGSGFQIVGATGMVARALQLTGLARALSMPGAGDRTLPGI